MKKRRISLTPLAAALVLTASLLAISRLDRDRARQDIRQLEQALRRSAAACYALEGAYPPNVDYMCEHYGLTYNKNRYIVHYELFASNFMPDIAVMERMP